MKVVETLRRLVERFRQTHDRRELVVAGIVWGVVILSIPLSRLFEFWRGDFRGDIDWGGIGSEFIVLVPFAALFLFNDLVLVNVIIKLRRVVLYVVLAVASALLMSFLTEALRFNGDPYKPDNGGPFGMMAPPDMPRDGRGGPGMNDTIAFGGPGGRPGNPPEPRPLPGQDGNRPAPPDMHLGGMGPGDMGPGGGDMGPNNTGRGDMGPGGMMPPPNGNMGPGGMGNPPDGGMPPDDGMRMKRGFHPGPMMTDFILALMMMCAGTLVKVYLKADRDKDRLRQLAKERAEAQLAQLRYQISPHFMMNTLNNIHALVDIDSERAKDTIVRLSRLMRTMLYEGKSQLVPLQSEVSFLSDYVELMRIRYTDAVRIDMSMPPETEGVQIPPLLFINIVENAFKHGVSYAQESFVEISLSLSDDKTILNFCCVNSLAPAKPADGHHGIGLENTRKRLELLCHGRYQLSTLKLSDRYVVSIDLRLE